MGKRMLAVVAAAMAASALMATGAKAVPGLGVASQYGYVNATEAYQTYWGGSISGDPYGADDDGFVVGPSGSSLFVFSNIVGADIYILTTADVGTGNAITFNGVVSVHEDSDTFRSYDPTPYYGTNLGEVGNSWSELPLDIFNPKQFYALEVEVAYTGSLGVDQWIFAAADDNGVEGLQAKAGSFWTDDNGYAGYQYEPFTIWVESNALPEIQEKGGKLKIDCPPNTKGNGGCFVTYEADTETRYVADTVTTYQGDSSSPMTTSARGGGQVPEPGTLLLLGSGLLGLGLMRRRRK